MICFGPTSVHWPSMSRKVKLVFGNILRGRSASAPGRAAGYQLCRLHIQALVDRLNMAISECAVSGDPEFPVDRRVAGQQKHVLMYAKWSAYLATSRAQMPVPHPKSKIWEPQGISARQSEG